jgi:hypothetical protein
MEVNNLYINDNLIYLIYNNLDLKDKLNFTCINKYTYTNYKNKNKNIIYNYIYKDYNIFTKLLYNLNYNKIELINITFKCIYFITYINNSYNIYDFRYIFEMCMVEFINKLNLFTNITIYNVHIYNIIKKIKKCIYLDRTMTIWNINLDPSLFHIHSTFKPTNNWNSLTV